MTTLLDKWRQGVYKGCLTGPDGQAYMRMLWGSGEVRTSLGDTLPNKEAVSLYQALQRGELVGQKLAGWPISQEQEGTTIFAGPYVVDVAELETALAAAMRWYQLEKIEKQIERNL